jgi:hypothetical protein
LAAQICRTEVERIFGLTQQAPQTGADVEVQKHEV